MPCGCRDLLRTDTRFQATRGTSHESCWCRMLSNRAFPSRVDDPPCSTYPLKLILHYFYLNVDQQSSISTAATAPDYPSHTPTMRSKRKQRTSSNTSSTHSQQSHHRSTALLRDKRIAETSLGNGQGSGGNSICLCVPSSGRGGVQCAVR
jgi:hypothetical protein